MNREPILWVVYNRASFELEGVGETMASARRDAMERSNIMPSDCDVESWDEVDFESDSWGEPDNWATAAIEKYLADHEETIIAREAD